MAKKATTPAARRYRPLDDRVIVRPHESLKQTQGGILLPDSVSEKSTTGVVIAVGPGKIYGGTRVPPDVKEGDVVVFSRFAALDLPVKKLPGSNEEILIMREDDILCVDSDPDA